jgi:glutamate--cysteine ligase
LTTLLKRRLALLADPSHRGLLLKGRRGIERETLRVDDAGRLATSIHPVALGAALTHPQITTDYAEALLEFVTSANADTASLIEELQTIHRFTYSQLGSELLWSQSMPCDLPPESDIAIATYGSSHIGMLKHIYRRGLALRYGKRMQCIAGVHYNFSMAEAIWPLLQVDEHAPGSVRAYQSSAYFALIRNFRRYSWFLMYLFGASPALSACFLGGKAHTLETLSNDTLYLPFATSLRMSDLGYQSNAQASLSIQFDNIENYLKSLGQAVSQPYQPYADLGTHRNGKWIQLSTHLLQIENEYYSNIRPKRVIAPGERAISALARDGVQYVEVRCLDIDPFEPAGISLQTARFLDAFLTFCALDDSPLSANNGAYDNENFSRVVKEGRRPHLQLLDEGKTVSLKDWGKALLDRIYEVASVLDETDGSSNHINALRVQQAKLDDVHMTPSAMVLEAIKQNQHSFIAFGLQQSLDHAVALRATSLSTAEEAEFKSSVAQSIIDVHKMEQSQQGDLDAFIEAYQGNSALV